MDTKMIIQFSIEITFGTLHILMTVFLISMRKRRKPMYSTAYFLIQIFINFADLGNVINGFFSLKFSNFLIFRDFYVGNTAFATFLYDFSAYTAHFEVFGHTLIAYNRYAVFKNLNNQVWQDGRLAWIIIGLCLSPLITMGFRLPFLANFVLTKTGQVNIIYMNTKIQEFVSYSSIVLFVSAFVITILFSTLAYLRYRSFIQAANVRRSVASREVKLLVHNCCMLLCLTFRVIYQLALLYATLFSYPSLTTLAQSFLPFISVIYSFSSSVFLLIISEHIRYDFLTFYGIWRGPSRLSKTSVSHLPQQPSLSPSPQSSQKPNQQFFSSNPQPQPHHPQQPHPHQQQQPRLFLPRQ